MQHSPEHISQFIGDVYRQESRHVFATLIRLLGGFDLAEDAMQDAFKAALEQWEEKGIPANPRAWLVSTGRFKAIDKLRRRSRFGPLQEERAGQMEAGIADPFAGSSGDPSFDPSAGIDRKIEDDILRLIFTCCHPALSPEARVAMTLREVCDLTTEEIARAFFVTPPALAQRIVRAKAKIREAKVPFQVPPVHELPDRLEHVLQVIYLVFNEGYYASSGASVTRTDTSKEAIRLGRLLFDLLPDPEISGLLALMLLHQSRRPARTTPAGNIILLEDQDRSLWDHELIQEGLTLVKQAFSSNRAGPYTLQAAIAAVHAEAGSPEDTDWAQITGLYSLLLRLNPSPIIELNRAVAIAMRDGPQAGLQQIDAILDRGELNEYHLAHSARAELCRKLGRTKEARASWERALALAQQDPERRFIKRKLAELKE